MSHFQLKEGVLTEQDPERGRHRFLITNRTPFYEFPSLLDFTDWIEERMETTPWLSNKEGVVINLNDI